VWRTNVHRTSRFRHSGIDKVRVLHLVKSRVAIPRINRDRRSGRGHVASDPGYRGSAFGVSGGKGLILFEIAIDDFPNLTGAVDHRRDTWRRILRSRDSGLGKVCDLVHQEPRFPESRFPDSRVEDKWHRTSGFRRSENRGSRRQRVMHRGLVIREIPK